MVVPLRSKSILIGRTSRSRNIYPQIDCESDWRQSPPDPADHRRQSLAGRLDSANGTFVAPATGPVPSGRFQSALAMSSLLMTASMSVPGPYCGPTSDGRRGRPVWLSDRAPRRNALREHCGLRDWSVAPLLQCHPRQISSHQEEQEAGVGIQHVVGRIVVESHRFGQRRDSESDELHRRRRRWSLHAR